ncbi:YwmB family TATA-box binding protein [Aneurinibacillus sp. Ricciae_BoGa-3]|uniref:YwmB family TATA-box binding protein n=1 Tax=Aneurinibacillus sp. Ricciae_BoGa-3 TaxID=3022697 RepID=UPI002340FBF9|nr:YwmB family TATA-box binding protein [Aneurinibacillus sp. Ricciae_BoGa-3]WCK54328.1 YwmB family TATA-box binding protein [Aneurinibacillus sp. Ricciae_BoGa-3]
MKKLILVVLFVVFAGGFTAYAQEQSGSARLESAAAQLDKMASTVVKTGAEIASVQVRIKAEKTFRNVQETEAWKRQTARLLSAPDFQPLQGTPQSCHTQGVYLGVKTDVYLTVESETNNFQTVGLSLTFSGKDRQVALVEGVTKVAGEKVINGYKINQINTCVIGKYGGKLKIDLQTEKCREILAAFNSTPVESLREDTVLSYSAYSPQIKDYILTNRNRMNLQVATHIDDIHQKTTVTVGVPIITVEY